MCIAIVKLPDADVSEANLRASRIANPDGAGFAYVKDGKVVVEKGFRTLNPFLEAYKKAVEANSASTFLIHFRIRSMGDKSSDNTHPFLYDHGCMIHNGTLSGTGATWGEGESDTKKFVDRFKDNLTLEVVEANADKLGKAIGSGNKLAFLFHNGKHVIVNKDRGVQEDGVWYSNYTFRPRGTTYMTGNHSSMLEGDFCADNWRY